jgi:AcrR family transcriptional regulator
MTVPSRSQNAEPILQVAEELFFSKGFRHTSIDEVAELAGVSKGTIYNRFENKQALFLAVLNQFTSGLRSAFQDTDFTLPVADIIFNLALQTMKLYLSGIPSKLTRMFLCDGHEIPGFGNEIFDTGVANFNNRTVSVLLKLQEEGKLEVEDMELAAIHFDALCQQDFFTKHMFAVPMLLTEEQLNDNAREITRTFLCAYASTS